jgi:uncharacterized protein YjbI with pentapeptide repeats
MPGKFLGKWTIYLGSAGALNGYASYLTPSGQPSPEGCVWASVPPVPVRSTHVAFILRDDGKLCFLLNNGQSLKHKQIEVGGGEETQTLTVYAFQSTIDGAVSFALPGQDLQKLPANLTTQIQDPTDGTYVVVQPADEGPVFCGYSASQMGPFSFAVSQVTPTLASIQASGKGDGLDFAWVDLTGGALDKVSLIGSDFSHCNLTNTKLTHCVLKTALLNNCTTPGLDLSGSVLAGANLNQSDLTGVVANPIPEFYTKPLQPPSATNLRTTFVGSKLSQSLLASEWSMLDLTGATIQGLSSPLSSATKPLQVKFSILTGLNKNNLSGLSLQSAVFDNAVLDSVNLNDSDLTNASFVQASMHGTILSNATLKNANMAGAQLGTLSRLFTLATSFEKDLNAGPNVDVALRDQFAQHGITLSTTASLNTLAADRVWQLNDTGNKIVYTVRMETQSDSSQVLALYKPATAASLVNAYMPDAILTGANLYGITANNIQFYGTKAKIDGSAILEEAKLNSSNLSTVNFTQAQLMGANLSNSHLFNARFNKANLTPSATGGATDLSNANLQGADFTDAQLYGANLTNAAVAIKVPTKANPKQGGVYLFSLPYNGDTNTLQQYITELNDAATVFSLNPGGDDATLQKYLTALKTNNVGTLRLAFLRHQPPITLSNNAQIQTIEVGAVWQIVDGTASYTLWTDADEEGKTELYAAPSLTKMRAAFKRSSMTLRWQASASIDAAGQQWLLDNDSENPQNFSTGYVKFILKLNGNVLDVYGTALRIMRLSDHSQEEFDTEACQVTLLTQTNMNADTVCPNGATLSVNQSRSGESWNEKWLHATVPPQPPACVPTDFNWCPPPAKKEKK